jgi:Zn finger protein HypA/HybF involved in hydrogenase expression
MHELSLALEVCRLATDAVYPVDPGQIVTVGVVLGRRAGVEPANFEFCLEALLGQPPFGRAAPSIMQAEGDELRLDYVEVEDAGSPD